MTHIPADVNLRAYLLGVSPERAKFLIACPHTQNKWKGCEQVNVVIPYDEQVQINEAKRIGIGASDAAKMFNKPYQYFIDRGFRMRTAFPKNSGNAGYSLFQYENKTD